MNTINSNEKTSSLLKDWRSYAQLMRLHRPIGTWLCLSPALWGLTLASPMFHVKHYILFTVGAFLVRGAGCTINDWVDQDCDKHVSRTKKRPLALGLLSFPKVLIFLVFQLTLAFLVLLCFNKLTILLGISIVIPIFIYPFLKRLTYWPQVFLGIIFNWGVLMGFASLQNTLSLAAVTLYAASIFWTIGYDTVYAFQDMRDDEKIGLKSSALKLGLRKGKLFIAGCYFLFFLGIAAVGILIANPYISIMMAPLFCIFLLRLRALKLSNQKDCARFFQNNGTLGLVIWAGFFLLNFVK